MSAADSNQAIYELGLTPGLGYVEGSAGQKAQKDALEKDTEKGQRVVVNVIGKERQGKTSLCKLVTGKPFDPKEESTVGMEQKLVNTSGVTNSWQVVDDVELANKEEFEDTLGHYTAKRLEKKGQKKSLSRTILGPLKVFLQIFSLFVVIIVIYYQGLSMESLRGHPWFGMVLLVLFTLACFLIGIRDGFGIAIGVYDLVIWADATYRWKWAVGMETLTETFVSFGFCPPLGVVLTILCGIFCAGLIDICTISIPTTFSLGTGAAAFLCMMETAPLSEYPDGKANWEVLFDPNFFIFPVFILLGLSTQKFRKMVFQFIVPVFIGIGVVIFVSQWDFEYFFLAVSGFGAGQVHGYGLDFGFTWFDMFRHSNFGKRWLATRLSRRYVLNYGLGLIYGIGFSIFFGWKWPGWNLERLVGMVGFFIAIEILHLYEERLKAQRKQPTVAPGKITKAKRLGKNEDRIKIVFRDYAGHPLYHYAHHVFMSDHALYVIAFSLVDAYKDKRDVLDNILYWLNSVASHARSDASVLLVGTFRDSVKMSDPNFTTEFGKYLENNIPQCFNKMLKWNDSFNTPLFVVDNSGNRQGDADHDLLRNRILESAEKSKCHTSEWPLKFFAFFEVIHAQRLAGHIFCDHAIVFKNCKENRCSVKTTKDFDEMLNFFQDLGEIIYKKSEKIVFDLQFLVDVMAAIVSIPKNWRDDREYFECWELYKSTGVAPECLLRQILLEMKVSNMILNEECVRAVFEILDEYDLICKVKLENAENCVKFQGKSQTSYYMVPAKVYELDPKENTTLWKELEGDCRDTVVYVDFGYFSSSAVFLRLLCQCVREEKILNFQNICKTWGIFQHENNYSYKLELIKDKHDQVTKNLIKITIRAANGQDPGRVVEMIDCKLKRIMERDFHKCQPNSYVIGPSCPYCNPSGEESLHVLKVYKSSDDKYPKDGSISWCSSRPVHVQLWEASVKTTSSIAKSHKSTDTDDLETESNGTRHSVLSEKFLSTIARDLGHEWEHVAYHLGLQRHHIDQCQMAAPHEPVNCIFSMLLKWSTDFAPPSKEDAVLQLKEAMRKCGRNDLVETL